MDSKIEETDDPEYQRVFTALDELKLVSLKPFFKEQCLQDDALFFMESEEELRNFLVKELKLPFGHGFKFSRHWFHSYHKAEGTLDNRLQAYNLPQVTVTHSEKDSGKNERTFSPSGFSGTLKNEPSATTRPSISNVEVTKECKGLTNFIKSTTQQQLKKDEGLNVARGPGNVMIRPPEKPIKEPEFLQEYLVSKGTPNLKFQNQQKSQELSSQVKTCVAEGNFQAETASAKHSMAVDDISCKNNRKYPINLEKQQHFQTEYPSLTITSRDDEHHAVSDVSNETSRTGFADEEDQAGCDAGSVHMTSRYSENETSDSKVEDCEGILMSEYQEEIAGGRNRSALGQEEESQSSSRETVTNKCHQQSNNYIAANGLDLACDWFKDKTCRTEQTALPSRKTELQGLLTETMALSKKEINKVSHAQKEGNSKSSKCHDQSVEMAEIHNKDHPSYGKKSLERIDSDPSSQTGKLKYDSEQTRTISDDVEEDQINLDVNNNSSIAIDVCDIKVSADNDSTAAKEGRTGKEISGDNGDESRSAFAADAEILIEVSSQRNKPCEESYSPEKDNHSDISQVIHKCTPRTLGMKGKEVTYQKGFVLDAEENREVEFKSLTSANPSLLPWKIMEKAKKFICACLNADSKGIIYYGVGDSQEQCSKFKRGEIVGLDVEDIIDDIMKAFQFVLDDHIKSDAGPLQKGGEQNCVNLEFVPVTSEGNRTSLYVIEIEVTRDWKFCKDNIYYSKCWTEKRGVKMEKDPSTKKALNDLYKVHKDEFDDVAIRTSGASTSVKQHEVNRQVKEPLMAKYKEWKRKEKNGTNEAPGDSIPDDADVKRFSALVRERLRDMNFKDFGYVLLANKLPPQYRGTPHLAFLQNIPWLAVFDLFDAASKKDGLHYVCNETTDAPRAKLRSLDDFKDGSSHWINGKDLNVSTRGTTWILNSEEMQKGNWIKCSRHCFYQALFAYKHCCPPGKLLCVFLGLDESGIQQMVDMMECCFSILGNSASSCVTVISESKHVAEALIKASKLQREIRECSISGIPWRLLKEIVREMVGPNKFEERGATTELPFFTGELKEVLNKVIHSWDDLEIYGPNPRLPRIVEDIEKERNDFYKGAQASQTNLFHNHCIPRTLEEETSIKIEQALKTLSKPSKDISCHVKTVTVPYEPGSGATTLCRRILWNKRNDFRCAVVKAITHVTDFQIEQLQGIVYDEKNLKFAPPCLILVDNFPENETRRLTEKIMNRKVKCVILSTFPIAKSSAISDFDMILRQLDEKEMSLVKDILINITNDSKRRRGAEEVLERERRFIWFGLELFGREYNKIEERLKNHIQSTLDSQGDSHKIYEMVLNFCCFLHYYSDGRAILPHPVVSDFLYEARSENEQDCALMERIHRVFGGLLLEGFNETNGYYGWRPAHSLVSEVVTLRINIEDTAALLLEKIYKGKAYVNKFLKEQVLKVFLNRKRISDPVLEENLETDDGSIDSDFESEVVGFYEVRTRYSPLIVDILNGANGIQRALRLLITICEKASDTEKAYAWQQLARFMGYEMRACRMDSKDDLHYCLHTTMKKEQGSKLLMPATGIEAAHMAVDIAIKQQPNYSHHYVTKGTLYLLQLRDFKPGERSIQPSSMPAVIDICRKALEVYDKALSTTHTLNLYSMIGKIQAIVSLLGIVKGLPFFRLEGERITRYLKKTEIPREMEDTLTQEEHDYVQGLSTATLDLLNELFRDVKFRQMTSYDENEVRGLSNAKIRASKLRRNFYEVTGFDRSELTDVEVPMLSQPLAKNAPAVYQQTVQDILFRHDETPYSSWANLSDKEISSIYKLLKDLCLRGYGSHDDMLICCKACLRLKERPSVEELVQTVKKWVTKFPDSEWAHLFNYMIHFPIPNGSLATLSPFAKESIKKCDKIVRNKTGVGFRRSGAEYFLGKGIGLYAITSSQEFRETKWENKTDFWRSKEISERLERVCGQKDANFNGMITYQGIQLRFDNTRYPYQSKDDLWFYVGFSVAGPYAYDPVDNDKYAIIRRATSESAMPEFPLCEEANAKDNSGTPVSRRAKLRELKTSISAREQQSEVAQSKAEMSHIFSDFPCSKRSAKKQPISVSMPQFLNKVPNTSRFVANSALSSSSANMSAWVSIDSLHQPSESTNRGQSYASALQLGSSFQEEKMPETTSRQLSGPGKSSPGKGPKWKAMEGSYGNAKQVFQPKYVDETGKLHHGAWVRGAKKSKECTIHTNETIDIRTTKRCSYAHSWRGDTRQFVCKKCTLEQGPKGTCNKRGIHEAYIWDLGPYYNEDGMIWKQASKEHSK